MRDEVKYSSIGLIVIIAFVCFCWNSCMSAANEEARYNTTIQQSARNWVQNEPQMMLAPNSVMCVPREFGSRMPSDLTHCRALTSGNYRVALLCNLQGCTIDHSDYKF